MFIYSHGNCGCKTWDFLVELSDKNVSALIVLKRLQRWICVQIIMVYKLIYFAHVAFDVVIVHSRTIETGVNLKTAQQPILCEMCVGNNIEVSVHRRRKLPSDSV